MCGPWGCAPHSSCCPVLCPHCPVTARCPHNTRVDQGLPCIACHWIRAMEELNINANIFNLLAVWGGPSQGSEFGPGSKLCLSPSRQSGWTIGLLCSAVQRSARSKIHLSQSAPQILLWCFPCLSHFKYFYKIF